MLHDQFFINMIKKFYHYRVTNYQKNKTLIKIFKL